MFPRTEIKNNIMSMRQDEKFLIRKARTKRLHMQKSAIINMQRLLNNEARNMREEKL